MNTTSRPCRDCGVMVFGNAAETVVRCPKCAVQLNEQKAKDLAARLDALAEEKAQELREEVARLEAQVRANRSATTTPEDVLRALRKRPELFQGVVALIKAENL